MLQDVSFYYKGALITSDSGKTIDPALLPVQAGSLLAASQYAPASQTSLTMTGTTGPAAALAAFDSTHINTGSFTAPASGNVLVTASCNIKASTAAAVCNIGLCAHGTVTPVVGVTNGFQVGAANSTQSYSFRWLVTGLTSGTSYNLDLVGSMFTNAATMTLVAFGQTATTPAGSAGGPVVMTVQAV